MHGLIRDIAQHLVAQLCISLICRMILVLTGIKKQLILMYVSHSQLVHSVGCFFQMAGYTWSSARASPTHIKLPCLHYVCPQESQADSAVALLASVAEQQAAKEMQEIPPAGTPKSTALDVPASMLAVGSQADDSSDPALSQAQERAILTSLIGLASQATSNLLSTPTRATPAGADASEPGGLASMFSPGTLAAASTLQLARNGGPRPAPLSPAVPPAAVRSPDRPSSVQHSMQRAGAGAAEAATPASTAGVQKSGGRRASSTKAPKASSNARGHSRNNESTGRAVSMAAASTDPLEVAFQALRTPPDILATKLAEQESAAASAGKSSKDAPAKQGADAEQDTSTRRVSHFLGVSWIKATGKWRADSMVGGRLKYLGCTDDEEAAARVVDAARVSAWNGKPGLRLNFPEEHPEVEGAKPGAKLIRTSSKFVGVTWDNKSSQWKARLVLNGRHERVQAFADELSAARAVDESKVRAWDGMTVPRLNFPLEYTLPTAGSEEAKAYAALRGNLAHGTYVEPAAPKPAPAKRKQSKRTASTKTAGKKRARATAAAANPSVVDDFVYTSTVSSRAERRKLAASPVAASAAVPSAD